MAQKKYWIGTTGPYFYDDVGQYADAGSYRGFRTEGIIQCDTTPTADNHVVRFQDLTAVSGAAAPKNATYVVISLDATLTNERVFAVTGGLTYADGGAGANLTIGLPSPFTSGNVLSANGSAFVSVTPDAANLVTKDGVQTISGAKTFSDNLVVNTGKEFRLYDADNSNYVGFVAPSLSANKIWTLPSVDGSSGQALVTNGSAVLSFVTVAPSIGGTITSGTAGSVLFVATGPVIAQDNTNFFFDDSANTLKVTGGLITPKIYPASDGTTAVQILKANGTTSVLNVDTTNSRIGIGTTSPTYPLHIKNTGVESLILERSSGSIGLMNMQLRAVMTSSTLDLVFDASQASGGYAFYTRTAANAQTFAFGCNRDGNVGIGTGNPGAKLQVNGSIRGNAAGGAVVLEDGAGNTVFRGIRATTAWSDAVNAQWFQIGNVGDYVTFTTQNGVASVRTGVITSAFHVMTTFGVSPPVGLFDVSNGSTKLFNILSTGLVGINISAPVTPLHAVLENTTTAAVNNVVTIGHNSTGTPAAGFGSGMLFTLESSTTVDQNAARFTTEWVVATHATRTARSKWSVFDYNAEREVLRIEADGSVGRFGAFGVTAVIRPTAYTQTYSTATKTHAARTAATLTDSSGGTANTTVQALPDPADTPITADDLRDDLVANFIPAVRNDFADVVAQINALKADLDNTAQVLNQVVDDLMALGWLQ